MNQDQNSTSAQQHSIDWKRSLMALVTSRIALIGHEGREAIRERTRALALLLAGLLCAFFTWALLLAGAIAAIAVVSGWPWHLIALGFAALHLVCAISLLRAAMAPQPPAFPITRMEFEKDRAWIEDLQNPNPPSN